MRIGTPKEIFLGENRVAMTPESALQMQKFGYECFIEKRAGEASRLSDKDYKTAGVKVLNSPASLHKEVDVEATMRPPADL
mgnify:CR=1 FL=1